jgi:hypothetical protein
VHILFILQTVFSILMLIHCIRTGREYYWWVIVMIPFGELVYFFAVFIDTPEFKRFKKKMFSRPAGLKELEYNAKTSPSVHNKMLLAMGLYDHGRCEEAIGLFNGILEVDPENKDALYALGLSQLKIGCSDKAIPALEKLVELDMAHADFSPCADLANAYWECGKQKSAVELLQRLVRKSERISHKTELGRYLTLMERNADGPRKPGQSYGRFERIPCRSKNSWPKWKASVP